MPWTTFAPIIVWAAVFLVMTAGLWVWQQDSKLNVVTLYLLYWVVNLFFFFTVNWVWFNYWLRFLFIPVGLVLTFRLFAHWRHIPFLPAKRANGARPGLYFTGAAVIVMAAFITLDALAIASYQYTRYAVKPVLILYPLRTGMYATTNGGNGLTGWFMNSAYRNLLGQPTGQRSRAFSTTLVEMGTSGMIAPGVLPPDRSSYVGWNEPVYAPCPGKVVAVENNFADVDALAAPSDELGNRVVIQCFEYSITLAGFRKGSLDVQVGDSVGMPQIIGAVGNSGTPSIPHLTIFTTVDGFDESGTPVPTEFEYRFLVRNALYIR